MTIRSAADMTEARGLESGARISAGPRRIISRTRGKSHGPITRLMSPGDLGGII